MVSTDLNDYSIVPPRKLNRPLMCPTQKPADEEKSAKQKDVKPKEVKPQEVKPNDAESSEEYVIRSPANIFLINKKLNPMFGVPQEKSHDAFLHSPVNEKNIIDDSMQKNVNEEPLKKNIVNENKPKMKRSVRSTGLMGGGFNFVKDAMKSKKGKK